MPTGCCIRTVSGSVWCAAGPDLPCSWPYPPCSSPGARAARGAKAGRRRQAAPSSGTGSPAWRSHHPGDCREGRTRDRACGPEQPGQAAGQQRLPGTYSSKSDTGMTGLSVALTSPASAADISKAKSTSDCSPVTGIGDFACLQWTGYFRGEASGASANVVLTAVRGNETLEMPYVAPPPMAGSARPGRRCDGPRALAGSGGRRLGQRHALSVPAAPPVGPPATTNNAVCALTSPDEVKQAFGAKTQPQILPGEVSCRYTCRRLGHTGPGLPYLLDRSPQGFSPGAGRPGHARRAARRRRGQGGLHHANRTRGPEVPPSGRRRSRSRSCPSWWSGARTSRPSPRRF